MFGYNYVQNFNFYVTEKGYFYITKTTDLIL